MENNKSVRQMLLHKKILLTFEGWYEINHIAFEYSPTPLKKSAKEYYEEYVETVVTDYINLILKGR